MHEVEVTCRAAGPNRRLDKSANASSRTRARIQVMVALIALAAVGAEIGWPTYGNDPGGSRYSPLDQINRSNVTRLQRAWTYRHGDIADEKGQPKSSFECTPIMVDGTLYFSTPFSRVIALDARTGEQKWTFDPKIDRRRPVAREPLVHRGVAYWRGSKAGEARILFGTYDARLFALDAATGVPSPGFGRGGSVDLTLGLKRVTKSEYQIAQPPCVVGDVVVMGSTIGDNNAEVSTDGSIRAFDVRTGRQIWSFDPAPGNSGAANAWAVMSADPQTSTVFVATSSPSPDYYGGNRPGNGLYGNCLIAIDARTGRVKWRYQVVHHDLWDYDIPAQPILCSIKRAGAWVPAVVVLTKMGFVFVLDRRNGKPLFPVFERQVPPSLVAGEASSRTQPAPSLPRPLVPQTFDPSTSWGYDEESKARARKLVGGLSPGRLFGPPSLRGTIQYPGAIGGCNWSGGAFDPASTTLYVNVNNMPTLVKLIPRNRLDQIDDAGDVSMMAGSPYVLVRQSLLTPGMVPVSPPPWGMLGAVDLSSGKLRWRVPLGITPKLRGLPGAERWGSLNLGGCIVTKGGLVFIAAALDNVFRAFDSATGRVLWQYELPAGGNATPMTYSAGGRQFVVICAGGHSGLGTKRGDYVIAFALPDK